MLEVVKNIKKIFTTVLVAISATLCVCLVLLNVYNVIIRYFTSVAFVYTEDITVLGMLWLMSLGLGVCWIYREHLTMNIIDSLLKEKGRWILDFFLDVLGFFSGIIMIYAGNLSKSINTGFVQSALGFDESFRYWPVLVGGGLLSVACLLNLTEQILKFRRAKS